MEISVQEGNSDQMIDAVRSGELDLALIGAAGAPPDGLDAMTIVSEGLAALVPAGHRLANRRRLAVDQLDGEPIVSMPVGTGIRATLDIGCAAAGFVPDIAVEASAADTVAELAGRGLGIGVLSASMTAAYRDRLSAMTLTGLPLPALLAVVWSPSQSPGRRAIIPRLHDAVGRRAAWGGVKTGGWPGLRRLPFRCPDRRPCQRIRAPRGRSEGDRDAACHRQRSRTRRLSGRGRTARTPTAGTGRRSHRVGEHSSDSLRSTYGVASEAMT